MHSFARRLFAVIVIGLAVCATACDSASTAPQGGNYAGMLGGGQTQGAQATAGAAPTAATQAPMQAAGGLPDTGGGSPGSGNGSGPGMATGTSHDAMEGAEGLSDAAGTAGTAAGAAQAGMEDVAAPSSGGGADSDGSAGAANGSPQGTAGAPDPAGDVASTTDEQESDSAGSGAAITDPGYPDKDYYNPVMPCEKAALEGSEIVIMGDSFYALSGQIKRDLEGLAKAAGAPNPYRSYAVSGSTLGRNAIPSQYDRVLAGGPAKLVIMDGGGNDQYTSYCEECPGIVEDLFARMAENGTEDVLYTFYPDPGNPIGSASFKPFHDQLRLSIREVCVKETALRCHFLDLRPYWKEGDTRDGLHPTSSGAQHVADAIWDFMQKDCLGQ